MSAKVVGKVDLFDKRGMECWRKARNSEKSATSSKPEPARADPKALPPFPPLEVMMGKCACGQPQIFCDLRTQYLYGWSTS